MAEQRPLPRDWTPDDGWRYQRFLSTIAEQTGIDLDHAERAAMATLVTLAERIDKSTADELAEDLPERLRDWLQDASDRPERFHVEELVRRVAEREEVDQEAAAIHARAVFRALARTAPAYEIDDLVDALPQEFEPFVGDVARRLRESSEPQVTTYVDFVEQVKRHTDLDFLEAERSAEVVLETLAERLPKQEAEDLKATLPKPFDEALTRGIVHAGGQSSKMSLDEFVERVARRAHTTSEEAFQHTRAVFQTLAEALPYKELRDILHDLPRGYRQALF